MARAVPSIIFDRSGLELDDIVLEIVDNSLDYNSENVHVKFFECTSSSSKSDIGFAVFDDGDGFGTTTKLFNSFEIQEKDGEKERKDDDIGKYHVGMKIAPLSKYNFLFVFTRIDEELHYCVAKNPEECGIDYDMDADMKLNPTEAKLYSKSDATIPAEVHEILDDFDEGEWTTCVVACHRHDTLSMAGNEPVSCFIQTQAGTNHFEKVLGMVYQKYLERVEPPQISVYNHVENGYTNVAPIDPFWKAFTPAEFEKQKKILEKNKSDSKDPAEIAILAERIKFCEAMGRFGTFEGYEFSSSSLAGLKIRPYVVPSSKPIRSIVRNQLPDLKWKKDDRTTPMDRAPPNGPSKRLQSDSVAGFFFYRDDRLINYGQFYDLNVSANEANSIRIEVQYPSSLDDQIKVSANKDRIKKFGDAWDEILRGLDQKAGGVMYAPPFQNEIPFFVDTDEGWKKPTANKKAQNKTAHFANVLVRDGKAGVKYSECPLCPYAHAPGEVCPEYECPTCKQKNSGCTGKKCTFTCSTCSKTGECTPTACSNQCKHCSGTHKSHLCPKAPKPKVSKTICDGDCGQERSSCKCKQGDNKPTFKGPKVILKMYVANKQENIDDLKSALDRLGIQPDELK